MVTQTNLVVPHHSRILPTGAAQWRFTVNAAHNPQTMSRSQLRSLSLFLLYAITCLGFAASAKAEAFQTIKPLVFTKAYQGANPLPQVFTVISADTNFNFYASVVNGTGGSWLSLTPTPTNSYYGYYTTPSGLSATVNPDVTLAAGTHTAQITLKSTDGAVTQTIGVSLIIKPASASFFDVLSGGLTFSTLTKDTAIPAQTVQVRNAGSGTLNFTASATSYNSGVGSLCLRRAVLLLTC